MLAAQVLLPLPLPPFSFLVPHGTEPGPTGGRVVVPWQGSLRIGLCTGVSEARLGDGLELRELICWLDADSPFFTEAAVPLLLELAAVSRVPPGTVLTAFSATGFHDELGHELKLSAETELLPDVQPGEWLSVETIEKAALEELRRHGLVTERARVRPPLERQLTATVSSTDGLPQTARAENQRLALGELLKGPAASAAALARQSGTPPSAVRALITRGFAEYRDVPPPPAIPVLPEPEPVGEPVLDLPAGGDFQLYGGLRRTRLAELLPLLRAETAAGLNPLVLAPELGILRQALAGLNGELPVLPFSGSLSDRERDWVRSEAATTPGTVLAGTYAALLLRQARPGSIIVLEAASDSWKLPSGARLFIPDAARRLGELEGRRFIRTDVMETAELRTAPGPALRLPPVRQRLHVTDLGAASSWPLDADLIRVLRQVAERKRQAVVLASRRGFSAALACPDCGAAVGCPNCDLPLRYHQKENSLRCHQCNHSEPVPQACPACSGRDLQPSRTAGTEWLQERIMQLLPGFPVLRYDADSRELPATLLAGDPGVLVTTIAGLGLPPLPDVSLIAVTMFDGHMSLGDFRAGENMLRLLQSLPELTRRERPLVIVQTFRPDEPLLQAVTAEDPEAALRDFTGRTLARREAFGYPPAGRLARVEVSARDRAAARTEAWRLRGALLTAGAGEDEVLGPAPAGVARVRGRYVWQLLLRTRDGAAFTRLLDSLPGAGPGTRVFVDVDPRGAGLLPD